ncbi:MAG TPA: DMT family transporter [Acetobacteraceae bacterium]|nr:DMT family transporter [Acetobacteraceae bacterium]
MGTSSVLAGRDRRAARRHAILCVLCASATFTLGSAVVKALTADIPIMEIVAFRGFIAFLALLPLLWRHGGIAALATRRPLGHLLRTLCGFVATATTVYGYATLPLATVTALGFAMPLFLTVLSVPLLGERVGARRGSAVLTGLGGVLLMLRPWQQTGALPINAVGIVLAGVVAWALAMISIRRMGEAGERNVTIVAWYSLGTAALAVVAALPHLVLPSPPQCLALIAAGLLSGFAQLLMTEGYRGEETTLLAPFEYGAILYATILGIMLWGEWPDVWGLLGVALLIGAGLYIWRRETTLGIRR